MKQAYRTMMATALGFATGVMLSYSVTNPSSISVSQPQRTVAVARKESNLDSLDLRLSDTYIPPADGTLIVPSARGNYQSVMSRLPDSFEY